MELPPSFSAETVRDLCGQRPLIYDATTIEAEFDIYIHAAEPIVQRLKRGTPRSKRMGKLRSTPFEPSWLAAWEEETLGHKLYPPTVAEAGRVLARLAPLQTWQLHHILCCNRSNAADVVRYFSPHPVVFLVSANWRDRLFDYLFGALMPALVFHSTENRSYIPLAIPSDT